MKIVFKILIERTSLFISEVLIFLTLFFLFGLFIKQRINRRKTDCASNNQNSAKNETCTSQSIMGDAGCVKKNKC